MSDTLEEQEQDISLDEAGWDTLLQSIPDGHCTPFLGAGACTPSLPSGSQLAQEWAERYNYPLDDTADLARVAQFLAVTRGPMFPKRAIMNQFRNVSPPDFRLHNEPHGLLADLPLPVYLTTNYDDFMVRALRANNKNPVREFCRWNRLIRNESSVFEKERDYQPSEINPIVFHLHGCREVPESLVLTEDDYVDFLISCSEDQSQSLLPPRIQRAFSGSSLLFLGYRLSDWTFRLLFRTMVTYMTKSISEAHVSVQLTPFKPSMPAAKKAEALNYLNRYFQDSRIKVYWGSCRGFASELSRRWKESQGENVRKVEE